MSFTGWVERCFSRRRKAIALYRSGIAKASKGDHGGAIADYSAAVGIPNLPNDLKAMVVYNRALAYSAIHEEERAAEDLAAVLHMPGCPALIRTHAQQRQHRIRQIGERKSHWTAHRDDGEQLRPEANRGIS